jgi:hypothetical protein
LFQQTADRIAGVDQAGCFYHFCDSEQKNHHRCFRPLTDGDCTGTAAVISR